MIIPELNSDNESVFLGKTYMQAQRQLYRCFNRKGSLLADFNEFDEENNSSTSQAYVNVNYIEKHQIRDTQGHLIHISDHEKRRVVLVRDDGRYSDSKVIEMTKGMYETPHGIKIIRYDHRQKFFTYNSMILNHHTNDLNNIVLQVLTDSNGTDEDF